MPYGIRSERSPHSERLPGAWPSRYGITRNLMYPNEFMTIVYRPLKNEGLIV